MSNLKYLKQFVQTDQSDYINSNRYFNFRDSKPQKSRNISQKKFTQIQPNSIGKKCIFRTPRQNNPNRNLHLLKSHQQSSQKKLKSPNPKKIGNKSQYKYVPPIYCQLAKLKHDMMKSEKAKRPQSVRVSSTDKQQKSRAKNSLKKQNIKSQINQKPKKLAKKQKINKVEIIVSNEDALNFSLKNNSRYNSARLSVQQYIDPIEAIKIPKIIRKSTIFNANEFINNFNTNLLKNDLNIIQFIDFEEYKTILQQLGFIPKGRTITPNHGKQIVHMWNLTKSIKNKQVKISSIFNFLCFLQKIQFITEAKQIQINMWKDNLEKIESNEYGYIIQDEFFNKFDIQQDQQKILQTQLINNFQDFIEHKKCFKCQARKSVRNDNSSRQSSASRQSEKDKSIEMVKTGYFNHQNLPRNSLKRNSKLIQVKNYNLIEEKRRVTVRKSKIVNLLDQQIMQQIDPLKQAKNSMKIDDECLQNMVKSYKQKQGKNDFKIETAKFLTPNRVRKSDARMSGDSIQTLALDDEKQTLDSSYGILK